MDFPRLQLSVISLIFVFCGSLLLDLTRPASLFPLAAAFSCYVYHFRWIAPYTRLFPLQVKPAIAADDQERAKASADNQNVSRTDVPSLGKR
jgi:hypothetical protein